MYYTGLDAHPQRSQLQFMDETGALGLSMNVATTPEGLSKFLDQLDGPTRITLEASCCYWWLTQYLNTHPKVAHVNVVDARRSRSLSAELSVQAGYGRAKNDRIDTEMMAEQDRRGLAPAIHLPPPEQLHRRTLNRHRFVLVHENIIAASRIYGLLCFHGVLSTAARLADRQARTRLLAAMPDYVQLIVQHLLMQIRLYDKQIVRCERELERVLPLSDPALRRLCSAPGFGPVLSRIVGTEIFDFHHFKSHAHLISYAGLAPIVNESNGKTAGPMKLKRYCNYYLKYAFMQAAHDARKHPHYQRKYAYDVKRLGKTMAKINLARRMAKTVYGMMIHLQPYKF